MGNLQIRALLDPQFCSAQVIHNMGSCAFWIILLNSGDSFGLQVNLRGQIKSSPQQTFCCGPVSDGGCGLR
jgi:hypothetical protein